MESSVLDIRRSPDIVKTINERYVAVELFTDFAHKIPAEKANKELLASFSAGQASSIPVYLIVSADGRDVLARRTGRTSAEDFRRFLDLEPPE